MTWLLLGLFFYFLCSAFLIAEIFVPSGGLLSILSIICLVVGMLYFFGQGCFMGVVGIVIAGVTVSFSLIFANKIFPHTRFGKSAMLAPLEREKGDAVPDGQVLQGLMDKKGAVLTRMRPVGTCLIEGKRIQCVAEMGLIDKGQSIQVIKVEGTRVVVRQITT